MTLALVAAVLLPSGTADGAGDRAGWRGPAASGSPPVEWSEIENMRWNAPLPGRGIAAPIVWGSHVFVATAVPAGKMLEGEPPGAARRSPQAKYQPIVEQEFGVS